MKDWKTTSIGVLTFAAALISTALHVLHGAPVDLNVLAGGGAALALGYHASDKIAG